MIKVKKLSKEEFYINPSLIETIVTTPDTVITLLNGKKYIVSESADELVKKITDYYKIVNLTPPHISLSDMIFDGNNIDIHEIKQ